jgi:integrase
MGFKFKDAECKLTRFVAYMDDIGAETVTMETALGFVLDPALDPKSSACFRRLTTVRGFSRYLAGVDARTEILPAGLVSYRPPRLVPYLYSDEDIAAIVHYARASTSFPFRRETLTTMIGLLAVTGMRVGEAIHLNRSEVDWDQAVILVRDTKFRKGRDVPVSPSTIEALAAYVRRRDRTRPVTTRLFVSLAGTEVAYNYFRETFRNAVTAARIGVGLPSPPRVHDLRHSFAMRTLLGWYRAGLDVEALLPRLSTYLGHRAPRFTYTYFTATPELLGHAVARREAAEEEEAP